MKDTTPEMEKKFREMLMSRSGEERVLMAMTMFDNARAIMRASLPPGTEQETRVAMFRRTYGSDFNTATLERICDWLRRH